MKTPSAIISSSAGLALFAAGCACGKEPMMVQASGQAPAVHRQSAAQQFQQATPLQTPTFSAPAKPALRPPQTEGPGIPAPDPVRDAGYEQPVVTASPSAGPALTKPVRPAPSQTQPNQKGRTVNRKALAGAWNSVTKGGKGSAPAGKSSKLSGSTGAMGIS